MTASIRRLFHIQPGEERLTFLLFALLFLLGIAFNFVETSVFPLFLSEFSSGTLPYLYIINGVVATLLTWIYLQLGRWLSFPRQLQVNLAFLLLLIFAYWLALSGGGGRSVIFLLPVLFQLVVNLGQLAFWTLTSRLLNLRQSKRLLGIIGSGLWVAIVLTGFLIPSIVRVIGSANLLLIACGGMAAGWLMLTYIVRRYRQELVVTEGPVSAATGQAAPRSLYRSPYVLLMFALTITTWLAFFFVDNIFFNRVSAQYPTEVELSAFLGLYLAGLGLFTLFNNTFLAGPIISRYGVRAGLLVLPLSLLIVTGAFSLVGTFWGIVPLLFWLATINRVLDLAFMFSVDQSAQTILYQPLPASERTRVQTIDNGIIRMSAIALAGVLLLLLNQVLQFDVVQLAYVLLMIVVLWLVGVFYLAVLYPRVLAQALARRQLSGVTLTLDDRQTAEVLKDTLRNPNPGPALYALRLLADNAPETLPEYLPALLRHPSAAVRRESLRRIEELKLAETRHDLLTVVRGDDDAATRGAAIRALAAVGGDTADVVPYLSSNDPVERHGALVGLLRYSDDGAQTPAVAMLTELGSSSAASDRRAAAEIVREWADPAGCSILSPLLVDSDDSVRIAALAAVGPAGCAALWPAAIACLPEPALRPRAAAELVAGGESALPAIGEALERSNIPTAVIISLLRSCGRISGERAGGLLLNYLDHPNDAIRSEALQALVHAGYQAADPSAIENVRLAITDEVSHAAWLLAGLRDIQAEPQLAYLRQVLAAAADQARRRIFWLLSFSHDQQTMHQVARSLLPAGAGQFSETRRSYALEMLDVTLRGELKTQVMPLAEALPAGETLQRLGPAFNQPVMTPARRVVALMDGDGRESRWCRIAAVHAAGLMPAADIDLADRLAVYRQSDDPVLSEVAARTARHLAGEVETGDEAMLSTIEKVILLKNVDLFSQTPDELLAEVAGLLVEVEVTLGQTVFSKDQPGDSLYIIVSGRVRVHDEDYTIDGLEETEVFGEMALLDDVTRMASVTAVTDTLLLRLDRESFTELLETRSEVAQGIIRVLTRRLRKRVEEVATLQAE